MLVTDEAITWIVLKQVVDYNDLLSKATVIPANFFYRDEFSELVIPPNIKSIDYYALVVCKIGRLFIAKSNFILSLDRSFNGTRVSKITQLRPICLFVGDTFNSIFKSLFEWEIGGDIYFSRMEYNPFPDLYKVNPNVKLIIHKDVKIGVLKGQQASLLKYVQDYGFKNIEVVA